MIVAYRRFYSTIIIIIIIIIIKLIYNHHEHIHNKSNINSIMPIFEKSRIKVSLLCHQETTIIISIKGVNGSLKICLKILKNLSIMYFEEVARFLGQSDF